MNSFACTPNWRSGDVFSLEVIDERPGSLTFSAHGSLAASTFANESGGHRWQRVPPNEKRGRVHTSTVTVAVLPEPTETQIHIGPNDLEYTMKRGSGPGGQHRNKTESAVLLKHIPTGTIVRCESERSQLRNKQSALAVLRARLWERERVGLHSARADERKAQVGSGMRGDKRRTIRTQDGQVVDHITGQRWSWESYQRGAW